MTPIAIFDRDGTIIDVVRDEDTGAIASAFHPDQLRILPGALDGMRALAAGGFTLAIATNQPGPAKGQISAAAVLRTNAALVAQLAAEGVPIAAVEACMHHPTGGPGGDPSLVRACACRKPKPGLVTTLLARLDGDPTHSWMIGDGVSDLDAGRAAGVRTALVFAGNRCELCPLRDGRHPAADVHGATLHEIAGAILHRR